MNDMSSERMCLREHERLKEKEDKRFKRLVRKNRECEMNM